MYRHEKHNVNRNHSPQGSGSGNEGAKILIVYRCLPCVEVAMIPMAGRRPIDVKQVVFPRRLTSLQPQGLTLAQSSAETPRP